MGEIKIGFDRVFRATSSWVTDNFWVRRTETDGGGVIFNTSRGLLRAGRAIEQVRFKETTSEKFYAFIMYDYGICRRSCTQTATNQKVARLQLFEFS